MFSELMLCICLQNVSPVVVTIIAKETIKMTKNRAKREHEMGPLNPAHSSNVLEPLQRNDARK